jgi:hypothetical protein
VQSRKKALAIAKEYRHKIAFAGGVPQGFAQREGEDHNIEDELRVIRQTWR